jgi:hypothetical protein
MCASAIRWSGFKEFIYGTSIDTLLKNGWGQTRLPSHEIVEHGWSFGTGVTVMGNVASEFTDPLFAWQYREDGPCPKGCSRIHSERGTTCSEMKSREDNHAIADRFVEQKLNQ